MPTSFDGQMRAIHDHLFANANIRLPEDLQAEVAKVIQALTWMAVVEPLPKLDKKHLEGALAGDRSVVTAIAREVRQAFSAYNSSMRRYPAREPLRLDDASLAYVRSSLDPVDLSDVQRDWLGDALEVFRSTAAKRLGGQFFTDQKVTNLAIDLLDFDPKSDDLVDICAGTGGFLIAASRAAMRAGNDDPDIKGIEADASLAHLANTTLRQMGIGDDAVANGNSLLAPSRWPTALRKSIIPGTHRCLATNPPFGDKITIKDERILQQYSLGHVWSKTARTGWQQTRRTSSKAPDILFIEKNLMLAEPGVGRVAIVLPYQILSGPKLGYAREWILRNAWIKAVVDLPATTFQPWTGTKTALVVLQRRDVPLETWTPEDYPVFMAVARSIGHDRRGNPVVDSAGEIVTDLPAVESAYQQYRNGDRVDAHNESFVISANRFTRDIDLRLNAAFHEPVRSKFIDDLARSDKSSVETVRVGDVTKRIFFPGRFKRNYVSQDAGGVPFLGGTNVTQLLPTNAKYIGANDKRLDQLRVEAGWVLVTRSGSTGIVSSVPEEWDGYAMSEHVIRIVPDEDKLPGAYLETFLRSQLGQELLAQGIFGSVIDEITPEHIANMVIPLIGDKDKYAEVVELQREANIARQKAINLMLSARNLLEESLGGEIGRVREDILEGLPAENVVDEREELAESEVALHAIRTSKH